METDKCEANVKRCSKCDEIMGMNRNGQHICGCELREILAEEHDNEQTAQSS
jgi:hypothetical protein